MVGAPAIKGSRVAQTVTRLALAPIRAYIRSGPGPADTKLALWESVVAHTWWAERHVTIDTEFGASMIVDASEIVGRYLSYFGRWEPNLTALIMDRLRPGDVFIDVGANGGYFSLLASTIGADAVAIEASPSTFELLARNLRANGATRARAVNIGAWHKRGTLPMFGSGGETTLVGGTGVPSSMVEVAPLSEILTSDEVARARFVKIDVEGAEAHVLDGLSPVVEQMPRVLDIAVEVRPTILPRGGDELVAMMRSWGFTCSQIENDYSPRGYLGGEVKPPVQFAGWPEWEPVDLLFSRA